MGLILLTVGCCAMGFAGFSILRPSPPVVIVNPPADGLGGFSLSSIIVLLVIAGVILGIVWLIKFLKR